MQGTSGTPGWGVSRRSGHGTSLPSGRTLTFAASRRHNLLGMTWLDWAIVAFTLLLAVYGYAQGFIVGMLSLAGFALGAFVGTRLGPMLLPGGAHSPDAPLFGLVGALLAGGILATGFEGIGAHARAALRIPGLRAIDGVAGAALTAAVALGMAWILGAIALQASGSIQVRRTIQRSAILRDLDGLLPPSGPAAQRPRPVRPAAHAPRIRVRRRAAATRDRELGGRPGSAGLGRPHPRVGLRPRRRGQRLDRRAGTSSSPTPTSSPASRTRLSSRTVDSGRSARLRSASTRATTSRFSGSPASPVGRCASAPRPRPGPRSRSSASRSTGRSTPRPAGSATPFGEHG